MKGYNVVKREADIVEGKPVKASLRGNNGGGGSSREEM